MLERPPSPSPNRPVLSDPDAHLRGRQGGPCAIQCWECPKWIAPVHDPSPSSHQGEEEEGGEEDEDDERQISVVTGPVGVPVIRWMMRISIGPRGQPQGPLCDVSPLSKDGSS
jgi:hypothetical protein